MSEQVIAWSASSDLESFDFDFREVLVSGLPESADLEPEVLPGATESEVMRMSMFDVSIDTDVMLWVESNATYRADQHEWGYVLDLDHAAEPRDVPSPLVPVFGRAHRSGCRYLELICTATR